MATIAQLLKARDQLSPVSDTAALDVELLLCHCLRKERTYLRTWPNAEVDAHAEAQFTTLLQRRLQGEPVAYLIGRRGFWQFDLLTDASTLIPRPETELLVEKSLAIVKDQSGASVLDLGTGTGAIALALASERPRWQILACDINPAAVALAERNREQLGLNNVTIFVSDWFAQVPAQRFDLIVSNPPYIDGDDPHLLQGDVRFEPRSALVSANHGFADIENIIVGAKHFLADGGWLLFEHGYNQGRGARERLLAAGFAEVFTERDLAGQDRVSGGCFKLNHYRSRLSERGKVFHDTP